MPGNRCRQGVGGVNPAVLCGPKRTLHAPYMVAMCRISSAQAALGASLPRRAQIRRFAGAEIGAPGIDVQAAAPGVAGVDGKLLGFAVAQDVGKDALDTLLVKLVVLAEADQVA